MGLAIFFSVMGCASQKDWTSTTVKKDETILSSAEIRQSIRRCEAKQDTLWASQIENFRGIASSVADGYITPQAYAELMLSVEEQHRNNRKLCSLIANMTHREMQEYIDSIQRSSQN